MIPTSSPSSLKSVINCDAERESAVDSLHKPTSECNQNLFRKLIANNDYTCTVIEMALEMELLIDDTKTMLMNNC